MNTFLMISRFMNKTFALWVVVFGALGFVFPQVFKPVGAYVSILLGVVMFGMGLTLTTADFREIFRRPKDVAVGILAQFLIMPLAAFVLCKAFDLPPDSLKCSKKMRQPRSTLQTLRTRLRPEPDIPCGDP